MRLVLKEYAQGGRAAFETTDDGSQTVGEWAGPRQVSERICAFVEVVCDNNEQGVERLLESLAWLSEEIRRRKGNPVGAGATEPAQ